jgi:hypothetical protein
MPAQPRSARAITRCGRRGSRKLVWKIVSRVVFMLFSRPGAKKIGCLAAHEVALTIVARRPEHRPRHRRGDTQEWMSRTLRSVRRLMEAVLEALVQTPVQKIRAPIRKNERLRAAVAAPVRTLIRMAAFTTPLILSTCRFYCGISVAYMKELRCEERPYPNLSLPQRG